MEVGGENAKVEIHGGCDDGGKIGLDCFLLLGRDEIGLESRASSSSSVSDFAEVVRCFCNVVQKVVSVGGRLVGASEIVCLPFNDKTSDDDNAPTKKK